jgi:Asp-tRNA(Asn)/Glu-tRNA(Gln) amidotransferase A subunit family amidase
MTAAAMSASCIAELQSLLRGGEVSPREVLESLRTRIEAIDSEIGAYLSYDFDAA